jgi:hypothetical protein
MGDYWVADYPGGFRVGEGQIFQGGGRSDFPGRGKIRFSREGEDQIFQGGGRSDFQGGGRSDFQGGGRSDFPGRGGG